MLNLWWLRIIYLHNSAVKGGKSLYATYGFKFRRSPHRLMQWGKRRCCQQLIRDIPVSANARARGQVC